MGVVLLPSIFCCWLIIFIICSALILVYRSTVPDRDKNYDWGLTASMICMSILLFLVVVIPLIMGYNTLNFVGLA